MHVVVKENIDPDIVTKVQQMLHDRVPESQLLKGAYRSGWITFVDQDEIYIDKVLFDTGAIHANYISKKFVDKYHQQLLPFMSNHKSSTYLGDGKTAVPIDKILIINVEFMDELDNTYSAELPFCVFEMESNEMIIGLPAILRHFSPVLVSMLYSACHEERTMLNNLLPFDKLIEPWDEPIGVEAPEDMETNLPCSFPTVLYFMEISHEEAIKEYLSQIEQQVPISLMELRNQF